MKKHYFGGILLCLLLLLTLTIPTMAAEAAPPESPSVTVSDETALRQAIAYCNENNSSLVVIFEQDITISTQNENLCLTAGNLIILGNDHSLTFTDNTQFVLSGSAALTLGSPDTSGTTVIKSEVFSHSIFVLEDNASLTMYDGVTLGPSTGTAQAGGVTMLGDSTFTMKGGLITECENPLFWTGAVFIANNAKFTMEGGKIEECKGSGGGAVSLILAEPFETSPEHPTFHMTGGTIKDCIDTYYGGGAVWLAHPGGSFIMDGGEILNCSAEGSVKYGGGVLLYDGKVELNGGTIQNCKADIGGGVCLLEDTFTMKDGFRLFNNTAQKAGADIYFNKSCILPKAPVGDSCSCGHKITGWFADGESSRWQCPLSTQESVSTQTPVQPGSVVAGTALIAAHGQSQFFKVTAEASPLEGGTVTGNGTYEEGANATVTATANEGYVFKGWKESDSDGFISDAESYTFEVTDNRDLMAVFVKTFTVTFDSDGGTSIPTQFVTDGEKVTKPADPTREGYNFDGWYLNSEKYNFDTAVTADITLMACWSKQGGGGSVTTYYTLRYDSNGGTEYKDERYDRNTVVKLDKSPSREGHSFTGWYADKELTKRITEVKMTSNKTVYAGWESTGIPEWLNGKDHFAYVVGYEDGTVHPMDNISRAEVATIFFRLLNEDIREENLTDTNNFADVREGMWCNTEISTMAKLGIIKGRSPEEFAPNAPITRAEFAAICARFDTSKNDGDSVFTDIAGHWAEGEIERAATLGWIMGYTDGTFRPENYITRAEAMAMINRVLHRLPENEDDLLDGMNIWPDNQPGTWYYLAVQEATNSHDFTHKGDVYEHWTKLTADPDWSQYQ